MTNDLISRKALLDKISECYADAASYDSYMREVIERHCCYAEELVREAPAVDAAPVVHGRWIHTTKEDDDWGGTFHGFTCSACDWSMGDNPDGWGNYCPNCGAKMDLEE